MVEKKVESYLSHEEQKELLKLMSNSVLRRIGGDLRASKFITLMMDECTDVSNREQVYTNIIDTLLYMNKLS